MNSVILIERRAGRVLGVGWRVRPVSRVVTGHGAREVRGHTLEPIAPTAGGGTHDANYTLLQITRLLYHRIRRPGR